ncbi:MAG: tetratricopeptide repeat protein [Prevotella sp.]|nr:tetratricopeptide repeat protein [Prevotella sp.]
MKKIVFFILMMLPMVVSGQSQDLRQELDSLPSEQRELALYFAEKALGSMIDSLETEGRYTQALEVVDSIVYRWETNLKQSAPAMFYIRKLSILQHIEEWDDIITTADKCLEVHKFNLTEGQNALTYSVRGNAYRNTGKYRQAIKSYENALRFYSDNIGDQANMLCNMATCYQKLQKLSTAQGLYEEGLNKFLEYFNTTRSYLLRNNISVSESYKKAVLGVFSAQLVQMAIYEQEYGSRSAMKEYLLMAVHCGSDYARREYDRIFGY